MTSARTLRIFCADPDATDSSSGGDEACFFSGRREGRLIKEVFLEPPRRPTTGADARGQITPLCRRMQGRMRMKVPVTVCCRMASPPGITKFRSVRRRVWGRHASEIQDTAEEATVVYDRATTNFVAGCDSVEDSRRLLSRTSALLEFSSPCSSAKGEPTRERRNAEGSELIGGFSFPVTVVPVNGVPSHGDLTCQGTYEPTVCRKSTRIGFPEDDDYFQDIGDLFPLVPLPATF